MENFLRIVEQDSVEDHINEERLNFFTSKFNYHIPAKIIFSKT